MRRPGALLALAAVLYAAGVLVWVRYDRRSQRQAFDLPGSAANAGESGASLALAVLAERAGRALPGAPAPVATLHRRLDADAVPAGAVVFRLRPTRLPFLPSREEADEEEKEEGKKEESKKEGGKRRDRRDERVKRERAAAEAALRKSPLLTVDEEEWVRGGGRLVLGLAESYGPVEVREVRPPRPIRKVFPAWPGVAEVRPAPLRSLAGTPLAAGHAVLLAGGEPVAARLPLGRGEVVLLACPEVLENDRLGRADHLALLAALAGPPGERPVRFDERAHGLAEGEGTVAMLSRWGLGPALALAALAAGAALWRAAVRIGPRERDDPDLRSEAVDLVESLGELYDRSLARAEAIRMYREELARAVAVETGLSGAALAARTRELAHDSGAEAGREISRDAFARALSRLNEAFGRIDGRDGKRNRKRG